MKVVTLLLEMSTSQYYGWDFGIISMIVQSKSNEIHQVNNVLTFAINLMIDFKFSFCL